MLAAAVFAEDDDEGVAVELDDVKVTSDKA